MTRGAYRKRTELAGAPTRRRCEWCGKSLALRAANVRFCTSYCQRRAYGERHRK